MSCSKAYVRWNHLEKYISHKIALGIATEYFFAWKMIFQLGDDYIKSLHHEKFDESMLNGQKHKYLVIFNWYDIKTKKLKSAYMVSVCKG